MDIKSIRKYITWAHVRKAVVYIEAKLLLYVVRRLALPGVSDRDNIIRYYRVVNKVALSHLSHTSADNEFLTSCHAESLTK